MKVSIKIKPTSLEAGFFESIVINEKLRYKDLILNFKFFRC